MTSLTRYNHVQRMYNISLIRVTYRVHLLMATPFLGYAQQVQRNPADFINADPVFEIEFSQIGAKGQSQ